MYSPPFALIPVSVETTSKPLDRKLNPFPRLPTDSAAELLGTRAKLVGFVVFLLLSKTSQLSPESVLFTIKKDGVKPNVTFGPVLEPFPV
jgi:hypothetical protein